MVPILNLFCPKESIPILLSITSSHLFHAKSSSGHEFSFKRHSEYAKSSYEIKMKQLYEDLYQKNSSPTISILERPCQR